MKRLLRALASLRLTMAGLALLTANAVAVSRWPAAALPCLVVPLSLLAINLLAALLVRQAFRHQAALLVFHVGLLCVLLLAAAGVLLRFDGRVEVTEGAAFDAADVQVHGRGWLHPVRLRQVAFEQGPVAVRYVAGLRRGTTRSRISVPDRDGSGTPLELGDGRGFESHGYRFMPTFNKGYALLLLWQGDDGRQRLGAVNFPSYPEFEWRQVNRWVSPGGETLTLALDLQRRVPADAPWTLASGDVEFAVGVDRHGHARRTLAPGESVAVAGGRLTPLGLRLWMGYRIDFNPLLPWLLAAAFVSLGALAVHVQLKFAVARRAVRAGIIGTGQTA